MVNRAVYLLLEDRQLFNVDFVAVAPSHTLFDNRPDRDVIWTAVNPLTLVKSKSSQFGCREFVVRMSCDMQLLEAVLGASTDRETSIQRT
jgi:hypothetical protein